MGGGEGRQKAKGRVGCGFVVERAEWVRRDAVPHALAYFCVHSRETRMASFSFSFQCDATSFARGSSCVSDAPRTHSQRERPADKVARTASEARTGLGAERRAWIERRTVRIWRAGDHLSLRMSRQMRPSLSMLGW